MTQDMLVMATPHTGHLNFALPPIKKNSSSVPELGMTGAHADRFLHFVFYVLLGNDLAQLSKVFCVPCLEKSDLETRKTCAVFQ